jgi:tetratricopeptide (TPR) repeat protein
MRFKMKLGSRIRIVAVGVCISTALAGQLDMKVRNYFFAGFSGDAAALERGMKICEEALAANPKDPEALVWHGSGEYFRAGEAFEKGDMQKGSALAQHGMKEMDDAVVIAPNNVSVRIPRGATLLTASRFMPGEMGRPLIEKGLSDYERTLEVQAAFFAKLETHSRGELLFGLAEGYSRMGNDPKARSYFERIQAELKDTPYAKRAALWLETKSLPAAQTGCIGCHTGK